MSIKYNFTLKDSENNLSNGNISNFIIIETNDMQNVSYNNENKELIFNNINFVEKLEYSTVEDINSLNLKLKTTPNHNIDDIVIKYIDDVSSDITKTEHKFELKYSGTDNINNILQNKSKVTIISEKFKFKRETTNIYTSITNNNNYPENNLKNIVYESLDLNINDNEYNFLQIDQNIINFDNNLLSNYKIHWNNLYLHSNDFLEYHNPFIKKNDNLILNKEFTVTKIDIEENRIISNTNYTLKNNTNNNESLTTDNDEIIKLYKNIDELINFEEYNVFFKKEERSNCNVLTINWQENDNNFFIQDLELIQNNIYKLNNHPDYENGFLIKFVSKDIENKILTFQIVNNILSKII